MNHFFRRILVSVWLTMFVASGLTFLSSVLIPRSNDDGSLYQAELVSAVARELQGTLEASVPAPTQAVADQFKLSFDQLLEIYLLDPHGRDVHDRQLPRPVSRLLTADREGTPWSDPRLIVHRDGLEGYMVVGFLTAYGSLLINPAERPTLLLVMLLVSAVVSYGLARFIVLPIRHLRQAGHRVAAGDLSVRVGHTVKGRKDDIALLARDFDAMTERIDSLLTGQQRLMRDVSHELRSPLARLQALQSLARQRFKGDDQTHILDRMESESERLNQLIEEILSYARLDARHEIRRQNTDLADLLKTIVDDALTEIGDSGKDISYIGPERLTLNIDADLIHRAVENVVRNAVRFTPDGTTVQVTLTSQSESVLVTVTDQGPGVPEGDLGRLFEPFFQVDESRPPQSLGSGVGLAIARRAMQLHQGTIAADNADGGGLRVHMVLPTV
ncbi:MAG: ATP-binding protein [Xanthomonadales bacterium]|nr:ATP-binding protein [Xanthomonadales bacterium]